MSFPRHSIQLLFSIVALFWMAGCSRSNSPEVTIYTSQDQEYAEPILSEFTKQTGIQVRPVFDSEAVKTVGLANRLLAERSHPQCDVFWNNEELRTRQLAAQGVFGETNGWQAVGFRSRRLVINTNHLTMRMAPRSLVELTNVAWHRKVALAYPLYGTTATHFLALRQHWGEAAWQQWCRALIANKPFLVDGNSVVVKLVGQGEAWVGLTDYDDIRAGQREGLPVAELPLTAESWLIRNTVAVVRGAPHPAEAGKLFAWLVSQECAKKLAAIGALEGVSASAVDSPTLSIEWTSLLTNLEPATTTLKQIFLR